MAWRRWGAPTTGRLQAVDRRLAVRLEPGPVVLLGVAVEARAAVVPVAKRGRQQGVSCQWVGQTPTVACLLAQPHL